MDLPRLPPELMDDAVAEILLRLPPAEPACLFRAALVCKPWLRVLCDPAFLRRYRAFHRAPPLLGLFPGLIFSAAPALRFVPATAVPAFPNLGSDDLSCRRALDCRHGRVLLDLRGRRWGLLVWDPVTGNRHAVPEPDICYSTYSAAMLCAAPRCDHLNCHGGPFRVALLCTDYLRRGRIITRATVYSSETGAWSETVSLLTGNIYVQPKRVALVGDEIYFVLGHGGCDEIGVYDWARNCLSVAHPPPPVTYIGCALMAMEDGSLGLSGVQESSLYLWSRKVNSEGAAEWAQCRVIDLKTVMPVADLGDTDRAHVIGFAEGVDVIFLGTYVGVFTFELKSGHVRKVYDFEAGDVLPYMNFYTPDEDFGNAFLSSWKLTKSGKDMVSIIDSSVPKSSNKFNFGNQDDFGLDGTFDKLPSFKMGMSDLDFSSPLKKNVKHNTSNGDDLSEGKKETEKDNFSFSFDFNEGIRKVEPALESVRGSSSLLSKSANMKTSRVELTSETALNQLSGSSKVLRKMTTHPTDLKREHKQANAAPKTALSKTYSKPALLSTSINAKGDRNAKSGLEPSSSGNSSMLNARMSTAHGTDSSQVIWTESSTADIEPPPERDDPFTNFLLESIAEISKDLSNKVKEVTELLCDTK